MPIPKRYSSFLRLCFVLIGAVAMTLGTQPSAAAQDSAEPQGSTVLTTDITAASNPNNLDTPEIMNALYNPHSDLTLLSVHRGLHALAGLNQTPGTSENSLASIAYAAEAGWEMIELDVKLTSDGVPILSHDRTWGREWCGKGTFSDVPYDPFTPPGSSGNDALNPAISGTTLANTRSFLGNTVIRDSVSLLNAFTNHGCNAYNQVFGEYPPTLASALDYISRNKIRMVVLLDIQSIPIAQAAYSVVASKSDDVGRPFLNSVVFKMPASLFPNAYADFQTDFGMNATSMNFIPVINTADVSPFKSTITDSEDGGFDLTDVGNTGFGSEQTIVSWLNNMESSSPQLKIPAIEVNMKESGGILSKTVLPAAMLNRNTFNAMTVGIFNPVGEYYPNGDTTQTPQFFRSSNGSCCDTLSQYLYNNPNGTGPIDPSQPVDHEDDRTDLNFIIETNFKYIITDDPETARTRLQQLRMRNLCYLQPSSSQSQNCIDGGVDFTATVGQPSAPGLVEPPPTSQVGTTSPTIPVLVTTSAPSSNFNLSVWELQEPTGTPGSPTTISNSQLERGYQDQYFFTNSSDGSLGMKDPGTNCVTTPNSEHCRTEFREVNTDGTPASWSAGGTNKLDATLAVEDPGGEVCIGQIHLDDSVSSKPLMQLFYYSDGTLMTGVEQTTAGGDEVLTYLGNVPVGTAFSYEISYSNNVLSISINGGKPLALPTYSLGGLPVYFKAGNYGQTTQASDVHFYSLTITHTPTHNGSAPPGTNFDMSVWELQEPTGTPGSPTTISNSQLEGGFQDQYFFTNSADGSLGMKDPGTNCVTTPNSTHCRTELREVNKDGSPAAWLANGNNTLNATLTVFNAGGEVCIGQIHLADYISSKPLAQLYYQDNGNISIGVEQTLAGGDEVLTNLGNVPVGQAFSYELSYSNNSLSVSINGGAPVHLSTYSIGHFPVYFKAGAYGQTTSADDLHFYALKVSHKDPTINVNAPPSGNFNLTYWELQLPTGSAGDPDTISSSQLQNGYQSQYFFTNSKDGSLGMKDPGTGCVTTTNSEHCRTELREVNTDGSLTAWVANGTNLLHASLVVDNAGGGVAIGQIHFEESVSNKPLVQLFYDSSGNIEAGVEQTLAGGDEVRTSIANVPVGTPFSYEINFSNQQLSISVNGQTPVALNTYGLAGNPVYFKAGAYGQTTSEDDLHWFDLRITHQ